MTSLSARFLHPVDRTGGEPLRGLLQNFCAIPRRSWKNTTQLFLAVRFNCNKCHDHPFERWTQDQYYQTAAFFEQVGLTVDPASQGKMIGGTDVEAPKPLYEVVADSGTGEVIHDRTKKISAPKFPFSCDYSKPAPPRPRRTDLSGGELTSKDNPYFAKSYVNRLWGYLLGSRDHRTSR